MKNLLYSALASVLIFTIGCSKTLDYDLEIQPHEFDYLGYGFPNLPCYNNYDIPEEQFIIKSTSEYFNFQDRCSCFYDSIWPDVDFKQHTLITGFVILPGGGNMVEEPSILFNPSAKRYTYKPVIKYGGFAVITSACHWVLIKRIPDDCQVITEPQKESLQ